MKGEGKTVNGRQNAAQRSRAEPEAPANWRCDNTTSSTSTKQQSRAVRSQTDGTKEMMQPCLIHLHAISLVAVSSVRWRTMQVMPRTIPKAANLSNLRDARNNSVSAIFEFQHGGKIVRKSELNMIMRMMIMSQDDWPG